jgi:chlorobactene glucosyltransferase
MVTYQLIVLGILALMTVLVLVNLAAIQKARPGQRPTQAPFVSVLVPARNEAKHIERCLASLARQDYPNFEILVLDDRSDDGTGDIIRRWETNDHRVRSFTGEAVPQGWVGKCYACHQLSIQAKGELLLFTDADTEHQPFALSAAVAAMERTGADLLSLLPLLRLQTFWERTIMPLLHFVTFTVLPFPLVHHHRDARFAMANGQFMLFRRSAYDAIGGHAAVRSALVEDVWLARRVKQCGYRLRVMDGQDLLATRMYTSLREIWEGFSKNLFPGFQFSLPATSVVLVFLLATSVAPFFWLVGGWVFTPPPTWLSIVGAQVVLLLSMRLAIAVRFAVGVAASFLHPLGMMIVIGIALNSIRWARGSDGLRWKGRVYRWDDAQQTIHITNGSESFR